MSFRKLAGGGAACAYCGFVLLMEGERQCCPAGRDYDALRSRLAEAEYAKAGLEGAVRIVDARVNKALNILDLIDTDGDDHYYSNADHARMILRGIVTMSEPFDESANRPAVESLRARLAEAERDAERYRYLFRHDDSPVARVNAIYQMWDGEDGCAGFEAVIDAIMEKK